MRVSWGVVSCIVCQGPDVIERISWIVGLVVEEESVGGGRRVHVCDEKERK